MVEAGGNLGAPPKPPCSASYIPRRRVDRGVQHPAPRSASADGSSPAPPRRRSRDRVRRWRGSRRRARPRPRAPRPAPWSSEGMPVALLGREVGAGVEGHLLGGEEHVQRPAALAGHRLARLHVDRVQVGPLLAVELDAHEALVHERGGVRVLEGLALHHVAPVAGRVADRQQDRHVALARRAPAPRRPTGTSPRGCPCAGAGTARSRRPGGWAWTEMLVRRRAGEPAERDPGAQERRAGQGHQRQLQAAERQRRAAVVRRTAGRRPPAPRARPAPASVLSSAPRTPGPRSE